MPSRSYDPLLLMRLNRETDLDDVLQISNVFVNVSKGEVARHGDLQSAFGKMDTNDIVKEVRHSFAKIPCCSVLR